MKKGQITLTLANPAQGEIGIELLVRILGQAGISRDDWKNI